MDWYVFVCVCTAHTQVCPKQTHIATKMARYVNVCFTHSSVVDGFLHSLNRLNRSQTNTQMQGC